MARAGSAYPQVDVDASQLITATVTTCDPRASTARALAACRRSGGRAVVPGPGRVVREADLARAAGWRLGALPAAALAWTGVPVVRAVSSEIDVRRLFLAGAPMVLVRDGHRPFGLIEREGVALVEREASLAARIEHQGSRDGDARAWLLRMAGKVGEGLGMATFAVGGVVRDLLRGQPAPDVDVVVEGDGIAFARRLLDEVGGAIVVHPGFGTASIEGARSDGTALPRIDVASARSERYERPGALPRVAPAGLAQDLARRDFTINAMAIALSPSAFGTLVDPYGGRRDLERRLLRPLHPLSFVEDPTRVLRGARYAARLGARLAPEGRRALALACRVARYPALSGQRIRAEIALLAREPRAAAAFDRALAWGAMALWHPALRSRRGLGARLRASARFAGLLRGAGLDLDPGDGALIALLIGNRPRVVGAALDRLAIAGAPRRDLLASARGAALAARVARAARPSAVDHLLARRPALVLAGAWIGGSRTARRRIAWHLREGRSVRPALSGADLIALGVPRGPAVGACLDRLRSSRLDGEIRSAAQEREQVRRWIGHPRSTEHPRGERIRDGKEA